MFVSRRLVSFSSESYSRYLSDMQVRGCGTALVTPFRQDGSIDDTALRNLVAWQVESGIDFLVPCGTTGEAPTLSHDEWLYVIDVTIEVAAGRLGGGPDFVGVKEARGDRGHISELRTFVRVSVAVRSGDKAMTGPVIAHGGGGIISVASNEIPRGMAGMTRAALNNDWATA